MKIRSLLLGAVAFTGLIGASAFLSGVASPHPQYQQRTTNIGGAAQPAGETPALPQRSERWVAGSYRYRRYWDGKNRTSGDRAHKRWKQRRRNASA